MTVSPNEQCQENSEHWPKLESITH